MARKSYRLKMANKRYIESLYNEPLFSSPVVALIAWSTEEIAEYRLDKNNKYLPLKNEYESVDKKQKLGDEKDTTVLKLMLSGDGESNTFKSQLKTTVTNNKENSETNSKKSDSEEYYNNNKGKNDENNDIHDTMDYTSTTIESTDGQMDFSNEPVKVFTADSSKLGKVTVRNMRTLYEPHVFKKFCDICIPKTTIKSEIKSVNIIPERPNSGQIKTIKQLSLNEVESLYQKYFNKSIHNTIIIIANILNIISIINKHHKVRMDKSFKKKTEAEKLKERCDANRIHLRHKKILESKLKEYFLQVITRFSIPEFEHAFQIFFLSILTILRVLDQPKFKKCSIFKNLVLLLWNSLKNSELDHDKIFAMFRSKTFRPDCIDLISLIEDSRDSDPGITDRMSLFFVSSVNGEEYFQAVINAVNNDSNDDLALLIDNAVVQCNINSEFQCSTDLPSSSTVNKVANLETSASATQNPLKTDDSFQRCLLANLPNGTFQPMSVADLKSKTKSPTTLENVKASQQLNSFYESFSNSIAKVPKIAPKFVVPTRIVVASSANDSNGILQTRPTYLTLKPATLQNLKSTTSRPEASTIYVGNKQYTVIRSTKNQLQAVNTTQKKVVRTPMFQFRKPEDNSTPCFAKFCENESKVMCSKCRSVKYCSNACQHTDWYAEHIHHCGTLYNIRKNNQTEATNISDK